MKDVTELILQVAASPWLYPAMFVLATADGVFPPMPSETILVAAAAITGPSDRGSIILLGFAAAFGATLGDNVACAIGRAVGTTRFRWMRR